MRAFAIVFLVMAILGACGIFLAACTWGAAHVVLAEPPSPVFQLPPVDATKPVEGDTPIFGGGAIAAGDYSVDVWGEGQYSCTLVVEVPGEPPKRATEPMGSRPICSVNATGRAGEKWHIRAELTGPGKGYISVRPPFEIKPSWGWLAWPLVFEAVLVSLSILLFVLHARQRQQRVS